MMARNAMRMLAGARRAVDMYPSWTRSANIRCLASASASSSTTWPVVIAGGGPTGLTTALLLSRYGIPCLVLERGPHLTNHPQAHFINHRTMEVFRPLSGLSTEIADNMPPLPEWRAFLYCTAMDGKSGSVIGRVDHFQGQSTPAAPAASPEPVAHLSQHKLLPLLAQRAQRATDVEVRMGHRVLHVEETGHTVNVRVESTHDGQTYDVVGRYLVAADGAHSNIRKSLDIPMLGPGPIQHLINIHFRSKKLGEALLASARHSAMLYFVFNTGVIAVVVAHSLKEGEFVAQVPYFPPLQTADEFRSPEAAAEIVRRAAGDPSLPLEILGVRPWAMSAAVAARYSSDGGRVLLAGDAAHVVPPSGALGMNTGIQDAHNLAWKLAVSITIQGERSTASGRGGEEPSNAAHRVSQAAVARLLRSYGAERRPVAEANMRLSVANFHEALKVAQIMGLDFKTANAFADLLNSDPLSWAPATLRRGILDAAIVAGRAASSAIGALRRKELDALFQSGQTLRLQYPKEDLGFLYSGGDAAVAYDPSTDDAAKAVEYARPKSRKAPYRPTSVPGARLPHMWLQTLRPGVLGQGNGGTDPKVGARMSSLDVISAAGLRFVLLIPSWHPSLWAWVGAGRAWMDAQRNGDGGKLIALCPVVVVEGVAVGQEDNYPKKKGHAIGGDGAVAAGQRDVDALLSEIDAHRLDDVAVVCDGDGDGSGNATKHAWKDLWGSSGSAVILVRPDGHVAWRGGADVGCENDALKTLDDAVANVLYMHH